jgi:hypothetical protein
MVLLVAGAGEATPEAMVIPGTTDVAVSFSWKGEASLSSEEMASMTSVLFVAFESNSSAAFIVVDIALVLTLCVENFRAKGKVFREPFYPPFQPLFSCR